MKDRSIITVALFDVENLRPKNGQLLKNHLLVVVYLGRSLITGLTNELLSVNCKISKILQKHDSQKCATILRVIDTHTFLIMQAHSVYITALLLSGQKIVSQELKKRVYRYMGF